MSKVAPQRNFEQLSLSKAGDPADSVLHKERNIHTDPAVVDLVATKEEKKDEPVMEGSPVVPDSAIFHPTAEDTEEIEVKLQPRFKSMSRSRVVSVDRGKDAMEEAESLTQGYNSSDSTGNRNLNRTKEHPTVSPDDGDDDDTSGADTSDGESSYFAKHLPSPKSSRPYSVSCDGSVSSAPSRTGLFPVQPGSHHRRESDASLSFSDDDDDDWTEDGSVIATSRRSPLLPPANVEHRSTPDMHQGYQITRMHSVSSLVSSSDSDLASYDNRVANKAGLSANELSDDGGETSTSDASVRSELRDVASAKKNYAGRSNSATGNTPSGRKSPTLGMETAEGSTPQTGMAGGRLFTSPPHHYPQASPPPIANQDHANLDARGVAHPQPQPFSPEQMAAWMAAGGAAVPNPHFAPPMYHSRPPVGYGSTTMAPNYPAQYAPHGGHPRRDDSFNSQNSKSTNESALVYSDDDTDEHFGHQLAGGIADASGAFPSSGNGGAPGGVPANAGRDGTNVGGSNGNGKSRQQASSRSRGARAAVAKAGADGEPSSGQDEEYSSATGFKVYNRRWLMLFYMSMLNLLSDWTCYSVAPIALLTSEAYGDVDPELLVTVFLASNAVASACEPIILSRLGLRRTVIFGALLLMIGSIIKSGGLPPILPIDDITGTDGWRVYMGFFLVGLSQPLYQCTPALLSSSWFPEKERTMATGVALNANQLGIGCAFVFGTLLVATSDDIAPYFGLLSIVSTIMFMGTLFQFEDAPPTPPSDTARVIRGTLEINIPGTADSIWRSVRSLHPTSRAGRKEKTKTTKPAPKSPPAESKPSSKSRSGRRTKRSNKSGSGNTRRRAAASSSSNQANNIEAPSPALPGSTAEFYEHENQLYAPAPSPMMPGPVGQPAQEVEESDGREESPLYDPQYYDDEQEGVAGQGFVPEQGIPQGMPYAPNPYYPGMPGVPMHPQQMQYPYGYPGYAPQYPGYAPQNPGYPPQPPPGYYYPPIPQDPSYDPYYYQAQSNYNPYEYPRSALPGAGTIEDMAEPVLTVTPNHLDIDIRDDQVIMSIRACFARPGFIHCLVSFTASGIVINTLSTFMDYLVRLNGAGREFVGIVGGSFQGIIMISSLIIGGQTDKSRAYYSVTLCMLVLGAFGLAECGVSLDADRGGDLRWALIVVAVLVGPLQPVSTELGVEVVYPISENTVLVIQQLFSNLLSAAFIPFFKALRDVGREDRYNEDMYERPQYTFSFYLLIVIHAVATVFFATFNGRYLRYEQEKAKKEREEAKIGSGNAFHPVHDGEYYQQDDSYEEDEQAGYPGPGENQPLLEQAV